MDWHIDHEMLSSLSHDEFLIERQKIINDFIESLPTERHQEARLLQQAIDVELDAESSPQERSLKISTMMLDSVKKLGAHLTELKETTGDIPNNKHESP